MSTGGVGRYWCHGDEVAEEGEREGEGRSGEEWEGGIKRGELRGLMGTYGIYLGFCAEGYIYIFGEEDKRVDDDNVGLRHTV